MITRPLCHISIWTVICFLFLEAYRDQEPSADHSSGSESDTESSQSRSQSPSSSGSSSSEEGSRDENVRRVVSVPDAPQANRSSALCLRNISIRSGGITRNSVIRLKFS